MRVSVDGTAAELQRLQHCPVGEADVLDTLRLYLSCSVHR